MTEQIFEDGDSTVLISYQSILPFNEKIPGRKTIVYETPHDSEQSTSTLRQEKDEQQNSMASQANLTKPAIHESQPHQYELRNVKTNG